MKKKKIKSKKITISTIIFPLTFFIFTLYLYVKNITKDVYSGDIGDLVTASYVYGVAHPPGYPLFTILGAITSHLPLPIPVVSRVALVSVFSSLGGVIIFYLFSKTVTKNIFVAILTTSILSFSYLYWLHSEIPEVFALNNFLVISLFYFAYVFYKTKQKKYLALIAFLTALTFTHHHTIILVLPGIYLLILRHLNVLLENKKYIFFCIILFLIGLLPYAYVPLAASRDPVINWDNATTFENFIHLILRRDYGTLGSSFLPLYARFIVVKDFFHMLLLQFSYQIICMFVLGLIYLYKKDKWVLLCFLSSFILSGPFFVIYAGPSVTTATAYGIIERFYTHPSVLFMFVVVFGFAFLLSILRRFLSRDLHVYILLSYFFIIPFFMIIENNKKTDLSKTQIGNNLARDILDSVPKNGVLYVEGDTTTFNIWYMRYVLNYRSDISIVNPPGVGSNKFLDDEVNKYHKINPKVKLSDVLSKTLNELRKKRKIYSTYVIQYKPFDTLLMPRGLVYELIDIKDLPSKEEYKELIEKDLQKIHRVRRETLAPYESNIITTEIPLIYSDALVTIGDFMTSHYKDPELSEHYYRRALWFDETNPAGYAGLGLSQYKAYNDCTESIQNLKKAIELYPVWKTYHIQLYLLFKECKVNSEIINQHSKEYYLRFKNDIKQEATSAAILSTK